MNFTKMKMDKNPSETFALASPKAERLAVKIAQLRKQRGLTQAQLAAKLDMSTPVISRLENRGNCTISTLKKVAAALDAVVQIDIVSKPCRNDRQNQRKK